MMYQKVGNNDQLVVSRMNFVVQDQPAMPARRIISFTFYDWHSGNCGYVKKRTSPSLILSEDIELLWMVLGTFRTGGSLQAVGQNLSFCVPVLFNNRYSATELG